MYFPATTRQYLQTVLLGLSGVGPVILGDEVWEPTDDFYGKVLSNAGVCTPAFVIGPDTPASTEDFLQYYDFTVTIEFFFGHPSEDSWDNLDLEDYKYKALTALINSTGSDGACNAIAVDPFQYMTRELKGDKQFKKYSMTMHFRCGTRPDPL